MIANDPHNRKPPLLLGFIAMVSGILIALFVISKVKAASEPQYIFYVNGSLYGTNTQRDIWVYPAGILDNSNVVYSYGPANAVQIVYTKVNGNWQESETPVHLQSTVNFTMVKGTFSYTNYEPEYVDEHFIPLTFDTAYSPKALIAKCTECTASDPFYNVVYFQDHNSFRWYCYAHNGEIRFCNDNVILVQPSGALWYWETQDDQGDRWVLLDTSHVGVQGTDYLVYKAMWVIYARGNNLVAVTDYSSATVPSWPPTHGGGHSFNDGYIITINSFGYDDTCTIDYMQCVFADSIEEEPSPTPEITGPVPGEGLDFSDLVLRARQEFESANPTLMVINFSGSGSEGFQNFGSFQVIDRSLYDSALVPVFRTYTDGDNHYYAEVDFKYSDVYWLYISYTDDTFSFGTSYQNSSLVRTSSPYQSSFFSSYKKIAFIPSYIQGGLYFSNLFGLFYPLWNSSESVLPTPTPSPTNTPTPTLSPTPPPYVIVLTPDPSPTPTPPFVIPTMPQWNPPGDKIVPLDPDTQDNVFGVFKNKIGDNNAFGLIGLLIGLLPGDLMWYLWFLLFVLLVVGVAKLIIHFTGG